VNAYPNPFADKVTLSIGSEITGDVAITVVDGKGRSVTRQVAKAAEQGARNVEIDLSGEPHGMYLLNVQSGAKREVIKVFKMNR
jgi:translation initiation factor 2 alpha subunit (eIF-2alpha)